MLGTPNITIGTNVFRPLDGNGGQYVLDGELYPFRNRILVAQSRTSKGVRRIKVERLLDLGPNATTGDTLQTARVYVVVEAPRHTQATGAWLIGEINNILVPFMTDTTRANALMRGES